MTSTYSVIGSIAPNIEFSTITFSSIPGTYTDLKLVCSAISSNANNLVIRFNDDSGTNYNMTEMTTQVGSTPYSLPWSGLTYLPISLNEVLSTTIPGMYTMDVMSYAGSLFKSCITRGDHAGTTQYDVSRATGMWKSTSAITSLTIRFYSGTTNTYSPGSRFTLYGIKAE